MYSDPSLIRKHVVKLTLSDRESELLNAVCNYTGEQKAVLFREMLLKQAELLMFHVSNGAAEGSAMPRPNQYQMSA